MKRKGNTRLSYSDAIIMFDTETSKKHLNKIDENHVVAFTISIRHDNKNIATLYGNKPTECVNTILKIKKSLEADKVLFFAHNLSYDWTFLRRFFLKSFGTPINQLNTKSHYPISIEFENGVILRDSLIIAQRSLDKWSKDLKVEHLKALGKWDYDKIRNQDYIFSKDELEYIEHDTLAGVECLNAYTNTLGKKISMIPYTSTGVVRNELRSISRKNKGRDWFLKNVPSYDQYKKLEKVFHGGYTHGNRNYLSTIIKGSVECYDFSSSYPYVLLTEKYPSEKFQKTDNLNIEDIIEESDNYAFMFKLIGIGVKLKNDDLPMPVLQASKMEKLINPILDNGRILACEYFSIYINEQDLKIIAEQYDFVKAKCVDVDYAEKDYLPKWMTDFIYSLFIDKTQLKGGDPVLYAIQKAKLNSVFGMTCQHSVKENIVEDYITGDYITERFEDEDEKEAYEKFMNSRNSFLPYQIGVWCTSYAMKNLFILGCMCETWLYSDTDSCYALNWNKKKILQYNEECRSKLLLRGYEGVVYNNRTYWPGMAEHDDEEDTYTEFTTCGAKRYCGRNIADNKLHITVAGVPKKGAECLNDDINNFKLGMIFTGEKTGKKTHTFFNSEIHIDENGNEIGDSIDLSPCDYLLNPATIDEKWKYLEFDESIIQVYDEF